jgi:cysteinyl-tRNA synthetase
MRDAAQKAKKVFLESMDDDFNTSAAVAALFDLAREINRGREQEVSPEGLSPAQDTLRDLAGVLGLTLAEPANVASAAPFIDLLLEVRHELRAARQFAIADSIRKRLLDLGIIVEDRPDGTSWRSST